MAGALDEALGRAAARWVGAVQARARAVVAACAGVTLVVLALLPGRLGLNADENAMFSEDVPYFQQRIDVYGAYPLLADPIVVVLDGETVDAAVDGAAALAARLREDPARFPRVFVPGGGPFFEAHGLLYLSADELEEWVDRLVRVQPYLAALSRDPSLRGFFDLLRQASEAVAADELSQVDLSDALERVSAATAAVLAGRPYRLAWSDVILGHTPTPSDRRRFVIVQPRIDFSRVRPAEDTIRGIQEAVAALGLA